MKRIGVFVAILLMAICLSACTGNGEVREQPPRFFSIEQFFKTAR